MPVKARHLHVTERVRDGSPQGGDAFSSVHDVPTGHKRGTSTPYHHIIKKGLDYVFLLCSHRPW
jgi:hypothetical protein